MDEFSSRMTLINDLYPWCERTECTLAIYNLDSHFVTQRLGLSATRSQDKGIPKVMPNGSTRIPTNSSWLLSSEDQVLSKDLRRHIDWLLDKLDPVAEQIQELQKIPDVIMAIRCNWWSAYGNGGPTLWPEQMEKIAELNLELTIGFACYADT